ncbi:MAG: hypothetical protein AAFQ99_04680, partial [Pseudomonadota bacterium]
PKWCCAKPNAPRFLDGFGAWLAPPRFVDEDTVAPTRAGHRPARTVQRTADDAICGLQDGVITT